MYRNTHMLSSPALLSLLLHYCCIDWAAKCNVTGSKKQTPRCRSCTKLAYTVNAFIFLYCKCVMYEIISRLSGNQHVCVSHRPSLISAPPTVHTPHGCTLIPVYWAGSLILCVTLALSHRLSRSHLSVSLFFLCHIPFLFAFVYFSLSPCHLFPSFFTW